MRSSLGLLRRRNFALLFSARCISFFGNAMAPVALAFAVLDLSGSPTALGLVLAARMLPNILLLLVGGVVADRVRRDVVLVGSNLAAGATQAAVAVLLISGHAEIWHLLILEALNGAASALFYPADSAVVPLTVPEQRIQEANALIRLGTNGTLVFGAAVAGGLVATAGSGWAMAADAGTFFVAAILLTGMTGVRAASSATASFVRDLKEGWREFTSHRWLWTIVVQFSVMLIGFFGAFTVLGPVIAKRDYSGASSWAAILGAQSLGLLIGGVVAMSWRPRRPILVATLAVFLNALPLAGLALGAPLAVVIGASALNGIGMELFGVLWYTALHENVAREALARVSAYDALGSLALSPIGLVAAGPLADVIGVGPTMWGGVALIVVPTALVLLVPEVRTLGTEREGMATMAVVAD